MTKLARVLKDLPSRPTIADFIDFDNDDGGDGWTLTAEGVAAIEGGADTSDRITEEYVARPMVFILTDQPAGAPNQIGVFDDTEACAEPVEPDFDVGEEMRKKFDDLDDLITENIEGHENFAICSSLLNGLREVVDASITLGNAQRMLEYAAEVVEESSSVVDY